MASQIQVTKKLVNGKLTVEAELLPGSSLPAAIFVYENLGAEELGEYYGIADPDEIGRFKVWDGTVVPVFGNRFLMHTKMIREYKDEVAADGSIAYMIDQVKRLVLEMSLEEPTVEVFNV